MAFFGNIFTAEIIARIFYNADKKVRQEIIDEINPLETSERDRISSLCARIRDKVDYYSFISSISIQAHARDTTQRDAIFVFRYKNEVKIGIVEAKLLRIKDANLNDNWDWYNANRESHFTKQVINQQNWVNQAAVWDMFIPNCRIGENSPPLERYGSSNIWAEETFLSQKISRPNELWSYQDVLDLKDSYLSLYDIIKAIMKCEKGIVHDITGKQNLSIRNDKDVSMDIPIPRNLFDFRQRINDFLNNNKSIESFNYYRLDNVFESVKKFKDSNEIIVPRDVRNNPKYSPTILEDYKKIVFESYDIIK